MYDPVSSAEQRLLERVLPNLVLVTDIDALADDGVLRRICRREPAGAPRVSTPPSPMRGCAGERRLKRASGVLLRNGEGWQLVATAAHCVELDPCLRARARLLVGVEIDRPFHRASELSMSSVLHFEDLPDRDLAIVVVRPAHAGHTLEPSAGLRVPPQPPEVAERGQVFVVGYRGGRDAAVLRGRVQSRVQSPGLALRGFNVELDDHRCKCISGSPVFDLGGTLLGVVQGTRRVEVRSHATDEGSRLESVGPPPTVERDPCDETDDDGVINVVALGGALSTFLL